MSGILNDSNHEICAFKVNQWLDSWDNVQYDNINKRKPLPFFYLFSISAVRLKKLCGIERRSTVDGLPRAEDKGVQRRHSPERSTLIREYVSNGSPYSELSQSKQNSGKYENLKKPGWLPTAIVVNILKPNEIRKNKKLHVDDSILIEEGDSSNAKIKFPKNFTSLDWKPNELHPIEVIDGQHRLWAFENELKEINFDLPVVAFYGLDQGWQAYLFWMINIKPKKINTSLAFDLYPLLRTAEWLDDVHEGLSVYRETRAQELTESFWSNPQSPWYHRINMLGDPGQRGIITQAGWIRSLIATFIKDTKNQRRQIGGLYGTKIADNDVLQWDRAQQAAFILFVGQLLNEKIRNLDEPWIESVRKYESTNASKKSQDNDEDTQSAGLEIKLDPAFVSEASLLSTDIGNRGFLYTVNDLCFIRSNDLGLNSWLFDEDYEATDEQAVRDYIIDLKKNQEIFRFMDDLTEKMAKYDWRTAVAPDLTDDQVLLKSAFRGGPGYKSMRRDLLKKIINQTGPASIAAEEVLAILEGR
ncbi:MAG: DGQHR domain-containing protein [Methanoregula sp.]|nr:DGQHR domain-containing protein [Methanoregula sp.]